jgi:ATP-binding cassette subfamily B protein
MSEENKTPKKSFLSAFSSVVWTFKIFWKISPGLSSSYLFTDSAMEIVRILNAFVFARGIDFLISTHSGDTSINYLYLIILLFLLLSIIETILNFVSVYSRQQIKANFNPKYQTLIYEKLERLGIQRLEEPKINNLIERTRKNNDSLLAVFTNSVSILGTVVALLTAAGIIFSFAPHLVPLFVIVMLPAIWIERKFMKKMHTYNRNIAEDSRSAYQSATYLQRSEDLQELIITGGSKKHKEKFENFIKGWINNLKRIRRQWYSSMVGFRVVRGVVEAYGLLFTFRQYLADKISLGDVTFYARQIAAFTSNINSLANLVNNTYESSLNIAEARELFEMEELKDGNVDVGRQKIGPEIVINEASFSYPGSDKAVISNLNLIIKSGEKIAIVGHNGAGKTTLIKLLLRFYKLNKGSILINSNNINDLSINSLYKNVGVLFQDYNTYGNLTAEENILIGDLNRKSKAHLRKAAKQADADSFILSLEKSYKQILSEKYKDGIRPSTGQWQKIAIARLFYRRASLVIFDEPTAAIDAVSEAKIFDRIYKYFKNKTVIIISHRFSTVRNADRIIVFDKGKIVEHGSHEELMAIKGKYYKAFKLQAKGYQ